MYASISATRCPPPKRASATARFAETVDLPTPPLPDEIARTVPRWGSSTGVGGGGTPPGPGRGVVWRGVVPSAPRLASVTLTRTAVTPSTPCTAFRTSRASEPGSSRPSRNVNETAPSPATTRSLTMPAARMSFPLRGFLSCDRACSTRPWRVSEAATGERQGETSEGEGRYTRRSGPSSAALPHLRHDLVEHPLLVGGQHGANVIHLTAEQPPHLLPRCGVGRIPGREGRHLSAIVLLDRVDFRLLVRCQRDVLEQHPHPPPRTTARRTLRQRRRREHTQRCRTQQRDMKSHDSPPSGLDTPMQGRVLSARDRRRGHARMRQLFRGAHRTAQHQLAVAVARQLCRSSIGGDEAGTGIAPLVAAPVTYSMARDLRIARRAEHRVALWTICLLS